MAEDLPRSFAQLMAHTVALSLTHVHAGGIPFAAVVVDGNGRILGRGVNRVLELHDPTAHAEVQAIRDASAAMGSPHLHGLTLLASGEPCAMCYLSALYAGLSQVLFAVDRDEAASHGFDYRHSYSLLASDPREWTSPIVNRLPVREGLQPFLTFRSEVRLT